MFNNTGSYTPNPNALNPFNLGGVTSPKGSALNMAQSPNFTSTSGQNIYVPPPTNPTPSGPVSSMKVTHPNGTVVETKHDTTGLLTQNDQTGQSNPTDVTNKNAGFQTQGLLGNQQAGVGQSKQTLQDIPTGPNYNLGRNANVQTNPSTGTNGLITSLQQAETNATNVPTPISSDVTSTPNLGATNTFSGLLNSLTSAGNKTQAEQNATADKIAQLQKQLGIDTSGILNTPGELNFQTGRMNALQNTEQIIEGKLQQQLGNEIAAGSQNIGALTSAAGLAQPQLAGFNQQGFNPITGQFGTGQGGGTGTGTALSQLPQAGQTAVQSYAQQVQNGSMTRADAESRLSAYGVAGTNALNEVLGTGFNTNASNASAQTTAQGQQLQTQAQSATQALDTLQTKFNALSGFQTGGIPATNGIANWIASNLGSASLTEYNQTLHDARQQLQGVLAAAGGGTPSGYESTAQTYLPDNMTPAQLQQGIANVKALIQQKVSSFTTSGQQNTGGNTTGGSLYSF